MTAGLALAAAAWVLPAASATAEVPNLCTQAVDALSALPAVSPTPPAPKAAVAGQERALQKAAERLAALSGDPSAALVCADPLAERRELRTYWSGLLQAAAPGADEATQATYQTWSDALRPTPATPPSPLTEGCRAAEQLIRDQDLDRASSLLDTLKADSSQDGKACAAELIDRLAAARALTDDDPVDPAGLLESWQSTYGEGLQRLLAWSLVAAAAGALLYRLLSSAWAIAPHVDSRAGMLGVLTLFWGGLLGWCTLVTSAGADSGRAFALSLLGAAAGLGALWARNAHRARLLIDVTVSGKDGSDVEPVLSTLVQAQLRKLGEDIPRGVDVVSGSDVVSLPVADIAGVPAGKILKAASALWAALTPRSDYRLTVEGVQPDGAKPRQVAVRLRGGGRPESSQIIPAALFRGDWTADPQTDEPGSWPDLAVAVASWVLLSLQNTRASDVRLYGATQWESVALNAVAARFVVSKPAIAAELLGQAADRDPANRAALFGAVSLRARMIGTDGRRSITEYRSVIADLTALRAKEQDPTLPLVWRLDYALGAARLNLAVLQRIVDPDARLDLPDPLVPTVVERPGQDSDRQLAGRLRGLAAPATLAARRLAGQTVAVPVDDFLSPREAFNALCASLVPFQDHSALSPDQEILISRFAGQPSLVERAELRDPFFHHLRTQQHRADLLASLGQPARPESAGLFAVARVATRLLASGVHTDDELLTRIRHQEPVLRAAVSAADWDALVLAARLRARDVAVDQINLLDLAGIRSVPLLTGSPPADLLDELERVCQGLALTPPAEHVLMDWRAFAAT